MLRRQLSVLLGFLVIGLGLVFGLVQLFALRSGKGDVFPPYSTLRADPLGAKALLDSLNEIPGMNAWRNYRPLPRLRVNEPITLVYLSLPYTARWEEQELAHFEWLIHEGSRAVFAFRAQSADESTMMRLDRESRAEEKKEKKEKAEKAKKEGREESTAERGPSTIPFTTVAAKWGFKFEVPRREKGEKPPEFVAEADAAAPALEASLPWHSEMFFEDVQAPWRTVYRMNGQAVLIERPWGNGSIVLASDSFFLSNEGLYASTRAPKLISWLIGPPRTVVFDEEHFGLTEQSGIATLTRKYRLHGFVAGLLLIGVLFVWQNIVRFVPPQQEALEAASLVAGRGSQEGFLALLRRSVPPATLLATCVAEWRRSFGTDPRALQRLQAIDPNLMAARKPPEMVAAYQSIAETVSPKR